MSNRLLKLSVVASLAFAGLVLFPARSEAQNPVDKYGDARLARDLNAELAPIAQIGEDTEGDLEGKILDALDNSNYDGVTGAELEEELERQGTSLRAVVDEALDEAAQKDQENVSVPGLPAFMAEELDRNKRETGAQAKEATVNKIVVRTRPARQG